MLNRAAGAGKCPAYIIRLSLYCNCADDGKLAKLFAKMQGNFFISNSFPFDCCGNRSAAAACHLLCPVARVEPLLAAGLGALRVRPRLPHHSGAVKKIVDTQAYEIACVDYM